MKLHALLNVMLQVHVDIVLDAVSHRDAVVVFIKCTTRRRTGAPIDTAQLRSRTNIVSNIACFIDHHFGVLNFTVVNCVRRFMVYAVAPKSGQLN